ncbi:MAG: branched-chain amino acid ABC transporter permease [Rhodobacter sp.]|nr:branched-chain amino acid ABC transporter permease [Paracoccaceae bacterium]MCC0078154.1 branched-chain amino acid ABC transporter permease [Rhodobacter sp.]
MLFLQTLVNGLALGGLYALAAVGFSLVFGVLGIVNLTHGIFLVAGSYGALLLWEHLGIDPILSIPPVAIVLFGVGYVYQRTIIHWAVSRASLVASLVVTFGVAMIIRNLLQLWFGPDIRTITPSYSFSSVTFFDLRIDLVRLIALGMSLVVLLLLTALLRHTHFGRSIRATAQQPLAASLCGLDVERLYAKTFGLGAALAGASGAIIGIVQPFSPATEAGWTLNAFIVVVLGGIGSPAGALLGGVLLGLINTLTAQYIAPSMTNAAMFLVLVAMLLFRPHGLLGNAMGESR